MKKVLLTTFIVVASCIATILIVAAFLPSTYKITRATTITASPENIMRVVSDFQHWSDWSPWQKMEPDAVFTYSDPTYGAGAFMEWQGEVIGKGKLTLTQVTPTQSTHYDLAMLSPFESHSKGSFELETVNDNDCILYWSDTGELPYPVGRIWSLFYNLDQMIGADFEKGLADIKKLAEALPAPPEVTINPVIMNYPGSAIVSIRKKVSNTHIRQAMEEIYQSIEQFLDQKNESTAQLPPFAIWHLNGVSESDFEAGFFMDKYVPGKGDIVSSSLPPGKVITVAHYGNHEQIKPTYSAAYKWISEQNYTISGAVWEVYVTNAKEEKDTAKWLTEIYFPIK